MLAWFIGWCMANDAYKLQGQNGGIVLINTDSWTRTDAPVRWVQCLQDTVLVSITSNLTDASSKLIGGTLTAGFGFGGETSEITLASGAVIAYY